MKISNISFVFIAIIILFTSCRKSVLSELEIESASILKVKVKIDEKTNNHRWVQVTVRDKTNHIVEFSNGAVIVNDEPTNFASKTVVSPSRGYNYRVPAGVETFEITIFWNETGSHTFMINQDTGFPGFSNKFGYNWTQGSDKFIITPTPFADGKIDVEYDIMK